MRIIGDLFLSGCVAMLVGVTWFAIAADREDKRRGL